MQKYVELKLINAIPQYISMSDNEGYKLFYENGKTSWEPKEVFEQSFELIENGMDFGIALTMLKRGYKLARKQWKDLNMFLIVINHDYNNHISLTEKSGNSGTLIPFIAINSAADGIIPWQASQKDILAEDWVISR